MWSVNDVLKVFLLSYDYSWPLSSSAFIPWFSHICSVGKETGSKVKTWVMSYQSWQKHRAWFPSCGMACSMPGDSLPLDYRCLTVLIKEVVCLDFGFTGRDDGNSLRVSYSSPLHRVCFLQSWISFLGPGSKGHWCWPCRKFWRSLLHFIFRFLIFFSTGRPVLPMNGLHSNMSEKSFSSLSLPEYLAQW